jgi:hypothetical protein
MKKLLFLSAVLLGAVTASQAGVRFNLGIGIPLPTPPAVVVAPPAQAYIPPPAYVEPAPQAYAPAPQVYQPAPQVYQPAPQVYAPVPQVYAPAPVVIAPPAVVVGPPVFDYHYRHEPYWQHFRNEFARAHRDHDRYDYGYHGRRW